MSKLNKVLSGFLALSMLATPVLSVNAEAVESIAPTEETETLYGDINSDGVIDNSDVDILKKAIFGIGSLTESEFLSADLNGDGKLNTFDLAKISKLVKEKRNLRVVEKYDYTADYSEFISKHTSSNTIYAYGRNYYYVFDYVYGVTDEGNTTDSAINLYITLNGIRHYIPTALESGVVSIDEITNVNYDVRISAREYLDLSFVKVIPPAYGAIKQPMVEYLYNDGKYDYFFYNLDSYAYIIEMHGKQYSLREVIDNQLLTPGELASLGLFDSKVPAPLETIETIEIHDPIYNNKAGLVFGDMLQLIYQDEKHNYYLSSLRGEYISVTINGIEFSLKEVIENEILTIDELIDAGLNASVGNYANGSRL